MQVSFLGEPLRYTSPAPPLNGAPGVGGGIAMPMLRAFSFDEIMAPLGAERFFAEYDGQKPLHLKGVADKFAEVMTWDKLNELLSQATIWSQSSLKLVLDKETIAAARYCAAAAGRDGGQVLRPDPDKVKEFLQRGATLVANDIDHLSPGLTAFPQTMEQALGGKVQGNLYLSSRRRQGFAAHFDTHDVFAVHVEGTKTWHVYEGRADDPIAQPMFRSYGRSITRRPRASCSWTCTWSRATCSTCRAASITTRSPTRAAPCTSPSA